MDSLSVNRKLEAMIAPEVSHTVLVDGTSVDLPVRYTESSAFMAFFPASIDRTNDAIGSSRLRPVAIPGKKCLLGVTVFDYLKCDVGPYREVAISVPVLLDPKVNIPVVPLVFDRIFRSLGFFTLQLAISTTIARKHSEQVFGYPTYDSNILIDITSGDGQSSVSASEGPHLIADMSFQHGRSYKIKSSRYRTFFLKRDRLYEVFMKAATYESEVPVESENRLVPGDHAIGKLVGALVLDKRPIRSIHYKNVVEVLHEPEDLGPV